MPGVCSFDYYAGRKGPVYKIRFDRLSCATIGDRTHAQIFKSADYILIKPVSQMAGDERNTFLLSKHGSNAVINVGRLVSSGFLHSDMFRKKYVVKRDKKGNLFVCLKEVVEDKNSNG